MQPPLDTSQLLALAQTSTCRSGNGPGSGGLRTDADCLQLVAGQGQIDLLCTQQCPSIFPPVLCSLPGSFLAGGAGTHGLMPEAVAAPGGSGRATAMHAMQQSVASGTADTAKGSQEGTGLSPREAASLATQRRAAERQQEQAPSGTAAKRAKREEPASGAPAASAAAVAAAGGEKPTRKELEVVSLLSDSDGE